MSGKNCKIEDDNEILKINSPKNSVNGPYVVVYKDIVDRWAIVALDWDKEPRLWIRWFWGGGGTPFSSANPIWLIIPPLLSNSILNGLLLDIDFKNEIEKFLAGEIQGEDITLSMK
jgi:hypothetical protein